MMPPTSIDGTDITGATVDGTDVTEITVDGDTVFSAGPPPAPVNRMYVADFANGLIRQFDLTNKFDLTGATQTGTLSVNNARDATITDSGNKLIASSTGNDRQEMYNLSTAYDISTAGGITSTLAENFAHGSSIDPSGVHVLSAPELDDEIRYYTLGTPYDLNSASLQDTAFLGGAAFDVDYVNQGEYVFGVSGGTQANRWELSTPYDFTTRSNKQTYAIPNDYRGIYVTDDGSKYFSAYYQGNEVDEFNLSTPYDISTRGSSVDTFSVANAMGVHFV
jgi:hypothetical protein